MTLTPICIAGPTGSGKTACAMALAELLPVEIISVDSALVYRGMDIGTAKPTAAERAAVPHPGSRQPVMRPATAMIRIYPQMSQMFTDEEKHLRSTDVSGRLKSPLPSV